MTINDASENQWVYDSFQPLMPTIADGGGALWIGLYAPAGDDQFVWVSGDSAPFRNFQLGQPDKQGVENYVHIWGPTSTETQPLVWGQWNNLVDSGWPIPCFGVVEIDGPPAPPPGGRLTSDATAPLNPGRQTIHFTLDLNGTRDLSRVRVTPTSPNLVLERGGNRTAIGALVDDGLHGDGAAGDSVFGLTVDLDVEPSSAYSFVASTAYRGRAARKFSDAVELASRALTPEESCAHSGGTWHSETQTCCLPGADACCGNPDPCCGSTDPACSGYPLLVGRGIHDITGPAAGGGMMGYQKSTQEASGIHDRQWARAFVVAEPNTTKRIVFVVVETGQVFHAVTQGVHDLLQSDPELKDFYSYKNLVISATHTHGAAAGSSHYPAYNLGVGGFQWQTYDAMVHGIFTAIKKAHRDLAPGRILVNAGHLTNANENRSPDPFLKNDELVQPFLGNPFGNDNRDTEMLCLRFEQRDGGEIGMINWFPVHGTSVSDKNTLLTGDNKGYAAYLFEKDKGAAFPEHHRAGGNSGFVAAFANSNAGDLSPNRYSSELLNGKLWPEPGENDQLRVEVSGRRQFEAARALYNESTGPQLKSSGLPAFLQGEVDYRHMYVALSNVAVVPHLNYPFDHPLSRRFKDVGGLSSLYRTFPGAMGQGMLYGTRDGRGDFLAWLFGHIAPGLNLISPEYLADLNLWHAPKRVYLSTGTHFAPDPFEPDPAYSWMPQILPISILRIGNLAILAVPAELTSMAGRRLRISVERVLGPGFHTVVAGYANDYSSYVTTYEEYNYQNANGVQSYEAGSTQFGPYTLMAYQTKFTELARSLKEGGDASSAPFPRTRLFDDTLAYPHLPIIDPLIAQPLIAQDAGSDGLPLEFQTRAAVFKGKALSECPAGEFLDSRDGGTCWSCPAGYIGSHPPPDQPILCTHLPPIATVSASLGAPICGPGQFFFGGACRSCREGEGFFRFLGLDLCRREAKTDFIRADDLGPGSSVCPGESFDPLSRSCYHCPNGYTLTGALFSSGACTRPGAVYQAALSVRLSPPQIIFCPPPLQQFEGYCYKCPDGFVKNPSASWNNNNACLKPIVDSAPAVIHAFNPCPQGGELAEDGHCRRCPGGYTRFAGGPLGSPIACFKTTEEAVMPADNHGTPSRCEDRNATWFTDPLTLACWSCPDGFLHVPDRLPLSPDACVRVFQPLPAELKGHITCEGRGQDVGEDWFLDLGLGECWSCGGWLRNLAPVNGLEGCTGPRVTYGSVVKELEWQLPEELRRYRVGQTVSIEFWAGHPKNVFGGEEAPTLDAVPTFFEVQRLSGGGWETVRTDADWDTTLEWSPFVISIPPASKLRVSWAIGGDTVPGTYRILHHGQYKDLFTSEFRTYSGESPRFEVAP